MFLPLLPFLVGAKQKRNNVIQIKDMAKKGSLEWKQKISRSTVGRKSPKYWLGKKHSPEYKQKMSEVLSGKNNPMYGLCVSEERKAKIRTSIKRFYELNGTEHLMGKRPQVSLIMKGRTMSQEARNKISEKASIRQIGGRNPNWRGGITPLGLKIRGSNLYEEWKRAVFERDNYTCENCGKRGGDLESHHKKMLATIIKENRIGSFEDAVLCQELWDVDNGITYCVRCHGILDKYRNLSQKFRLEVRNV